MLYFSKESYNYLNIILLKANNVLSAESSTSDNKSDNRKALMYGLPQIS